MIKLYILPFFLSFWLGFWDTIAELEMYVNMCYCNHNYKIKSIPKAKQLRMSICLYGVNQFLIISV